MLQKPDMRRRVLAGRYELEKKLGHGAVGTVYRAVDLRTHQPCAIKILHHATLLDDDTYQRFLGEARIASWLCHPSIVEVREFNHDEDGAPFMVMEFLSGEDLFAHLRRERRLTLGRTLDILRQVGSALYAAHGLGVVHRDIKPQNIFLHQVPAPSGEALEVVKVIDFGLSKVMDTTLRHTETGIIVGTLEYISPEATLGYSEGVDMRADQWGLAVVAYRMLSGRLPFESDDLAALILKVRQQPPPPLRLLVPELPAHVSWAIEKAMSKHKEERFTSVLDFVRALREPLPRSTALLAEALERLSAGPEVSPPAASLEAHLTTEAGSGDYSIVIEGGEEPPREAAGLAPTRQPAPRRRHTPVLEVMAVALPCAALALGTVHLPTILSRTGHQVRHSEPAPAGKPVATSVPHKAEGAMEKGPLPPAIRIISPGDPQEGFLAGRSRTHRIARSHSPKRPFSAPEEDLRQNRPQSPPADATAPVEHLLEPAPAPLVTEPTPIQGRRPMERIRGEDPRLPEVVKQMYRGSTTEIAYQVCVDEKGWVQSVLPTTNIPWAEKSIRETLKRWRFASWPRPTCSIFTFQFVIP